MFWVDLGPGCPKMVGCKFSYHHFGFGTDPASISDDNEGIFSILRSF